MVMLMKVMVGWCWQSTVGGGGLVVADWQSTVGGGGLVVILWRGMFLLMSWCFGGDVVVVANCGGGGRI